MPNAELQPRTISLRFSVLLKRAIAGVFLIVCLIIAWDLLTYDSKAWLEDHSHLKNELAQNYANLDWVVQHRKIDLRALDEETQQSIRGAYSRIGATFAIRRFVTAFRDPHLKLVIDDGSTDSQSSNTQTLSPAPPTKIASIEDVGYEIGERSFRFPFDRLPHWKQLDNQYFPTGISDQLGVLRIASFGEDQYLDACRTIFQPNMTRVALKLAVRSLLQSKLKESLSILKKAGAKSLLVDITGNGGGTEWVTEVIPLLTDKELIRRPARYIGTKEDRSAIWQGKEVTPVLGPEGEPLRLVGHGIWSGPLFLLVDHNTGSASEDFTAWLKENHVAVIIGEQTAGAGGGYVNGGGRIRLEAGYFDVMAPNCARFLADGTNEIEGIKPDISCNMKSKDKGKLAQELLEAVRQPN